MKKIILIFIVLISFIFVYIGMSAVSIYTYGNYDETRKADVAIVLGASVSYTKVSPVYRERLNHAIKLYQKGYVKKIIVTGGKISGQKYSDASVAKKYVISKGISSSSVLIEEYSSDTRENLIYAKKIMDENNDQTALIVSDPLHMKRAVLMAKDLNIKSYSSPTQTTVYKTREKKIKFMEKELFSYLAYKFYRLLK